MSNKFEYPEVEVRLTGTDGNVFAILGTVGAALRKAGVSAEERDEFMHEATSKASYDEVLAFIMGAVSVS